MHIRASGRFLSSLRRSVREPRDCTQRRLGAKLFWMRIPLALLLVAFTVVITACMRTVTHEPDANSSDTTSDTTTYDGAPQIEGPAEYTPTLASTETPPVQAYQGSWVGKVERTADNVPVTGRERAMGVLQTNAPYGYEGWYAAAFYFPPNTFSGNDPSQTGDIDIMRWDNERTSASDPVADFGGIRIGADHRARLVYGTNDTATNPQVIGEQFALREGCWNWLAVKQKFGTEADGTAKNEVWLNGKKVIAADGAGNIADARGADDVKFGYNTIDTGQQKSLTYYMDNATIAALDENPAAPTGTGLCSPLPNILLIVTDDQRYLPASTLSAWMPNVTQYFAQGGTTVPDAYVTSPECCPSRASILSGRYPHNTGITNPGLPPSSPAYDPNGTFQKSTLEYYLKGLGYQTAIFGKYFNGWDLNQNPPWFDHWSISNTGAAYCNFQVNEQQANGQGAVLPKHGTLGSGTNGAFCGPAGDYSTTYFGNKAQAFIQSANATNGRPWFLYVAVHAPHATNEVGGSKFIPEETYADSVPSEPLTTTAHQEADVSDKPPYVQHSQLAAGQTPLPNPPPFYTLPAYPCCSFNLYPSSATTQQERRRDQLRTLRSVDDVVGQLFQTLQDPSIGEDNNTLSFFTSDNGYLWNEHWLEGKLTPYTYSTMVPMYVRWPGSNPPLPSNEPPRLVANIDIAPTVVDALNPLISVDPSVPMDGRSLLDMAWTRPYLIFEYAHSTNSDVSDPKAACEVPSWDALRAPHWQYTRYAALDDQNCHGGYHADPFKEFYGEDQEPYSNDVIEMLNNRYGGDGDPSNDPTAPAPKDSELDDALNCKGQGQVTGHPACP
jgi:arylsulfatase A-like enzyme